MYFDYYCVVSCILLPLASPFCNFNVGFCSGVNPNIFWAAIEAPKAPRGMGCGEGCPPPHWGRGLGRGHSPLPRNFFWFWISKWRFVVHFCIFVVQFFAVQLKLWGGEKILSPRYIFIGGGNRPIAPSPPGIDATVRFYSQRLCTAAINTSNTTRTHTGAAER